MTQPDNNRPVGGTPGTDAAANEDAQDAAITATGLDIDNDHADEKPLNRSQDAPENENPEQDDEPAQAQTVAGEAMRRESNPPYGQESEHGGQPNPAQLGADDAQDVVDHMNQMERSGQIDMDAYRGERNDDDESEMLGQGGMEPDDLDEHGNKPRDEQFTPVE